MGDFRQALRSLRSRPGFLVTAVLTLAMGIGANTAVFSAVLAVLLRPLPFPDSDRLAVLWMKTPDGEKRPISVRAFQMWREQNRSFEQMALLAGWFFTVRNGDSVEQVLGGRVSANLFPLLGARPLHGRLFLAGEDDAAASRVAVLSHSLWQRRFAGDRSVLGQPVSMNGEVHTVVGVLPPGFTVFAVPMEVWVPLVADKGFGLDHHRSVAVARLRSGAGIAQAEADMTRIAARFGEVIPSLGHWGVIVTTLHEELTGKAKVGLWTLQGAVILVLLIACANVGNLLLVRASARTREVAVRAAMGASRWRLARRLLAESAILSGAGTVAAVALAWGALKLLAAFTPGGMPRIDQAAIDPVVLAFAMALSILVCLVFTLVPMRQVLGSGHIPALREGCRGAVSSGMGHGRRRALVVAEVALSLMLLIGAGVLVKSFWRLQTMDRGWRPERLLSFQVNLPPARYATPPALAAMHQQILDRIATLPGVEASGASTSVPLDGQRVIGMFYGIEGKPVRDAAQMPSAPTHLVSPGYIRLMRMRLLEGREFTGRDRANEPWVVLVSRSLAQRNWPGESAIGRRILVATPGGKGKTDQPREVVGVVEDVQYPTARPEESMEIYMPYLQNTWPFYHVLVRTRADSMSLASAIRGELRRLDPELAVYDPQPMEALLGKINRRPRWNGVLFGVFAVVALLLAGVGVYGVISYSVTQRVQEIGVRMALGAQAGDIRRWVLGQGLILTGIGVGLGLAGYLAASRLLSKLLFGVSALDGVTIAAAGGAIGAIALAAMYVPARRATRVDPMSALRAE